MIIDGRTKRKRKALSSWYDRLRELYKYKQDNGDCLVPQKYPSNEKMATWVNNTRSKPQSLTQTQKEALKAVGFVWAKPKGRALWDGRFTESRVYKATHGHCNVPTKSRVRVELQRPAQQSHTTLTLDPCVRI
jgi:Helicase associated domain